MSLTDDELLAASTVALSLLKSTDKPDKFGRYRPEIERLIEAVRHSAHAKLQHERYGDDH